MRMMTKLTGLFDLVPVQPDLIPGHVDAKGHVVLFNAVGIEIIQLAVNGAQAGDFFVGVLRVVVGLAVLGAPAGVDRSRFLFLILAAEQPGEQPPEKAIFVTQVDALRLGILQRAGIQRLLDLLRGQQYAALRGVLGGGVVLGGAVRCGSLRPCAASSGVSSSSMAGEFSSSSAASPAGCAGVSGVSGAAAASSGSAGTVSAVSGFFACSGTDSACCGCAVLSAVCSGAVAVLSAAGAGSAGAVCCGASAVMWGTTAPTVKVSGCADSRVAAPAPPTAEPAPWSALQWLSPPCGGLCRIGQIAFSSVVSASESPGGAALCCTGSLPLARGGPAFIPRRPWVQDKKDGG